jgi:hypothetical protein
LIARFRTLATDFDGRVGFRVYVGQVVLHRVVAGQRVVADDGARNSPSRRVRRRTPRKGYFLARRRATAGAAVEFWGRRR